MTAWDRPFVTPDQVAIRKALVEQHTCSRLVHPDLFGEYELQGNYSDSWFLPGFTAMYPLITDGLNTTAKGDVAEQAVVLALMASGKTVLRPVSNGLRYDLVVDNLDGSFTRVQCKTGALKCGGSVLRFRAYNADARRPNGVPYFGQVDAFGVYCPQDGRVYFVPIGELRGITSEVSLRLAPTRSGQEKGVRFAAAYLLGATRK
jgi:hypothetical protein